MLSFCWWMVSCWRDVLTDGCSAWLYRTLCYSMVVSAMDGNRFFSAHCTKDSHTVTYKKISKEGTLSNPAGFTSYWAGSTLKSCDQYFCIGGNQSRIHHTAIFLTWGQILVSEMPTWKRRMDSTMNLATSQCTLSGRLFYFNSCVQGLCLCGLSTLRILVVNNLATLVNHYVSLLLHPWSFRFWMSLVIIDILHWPLFPIIYTIRKKNYRWSLHSGWITITLCFFSDFHIFSLTAFSNRWTDARWADIWNGKSKKLPLSDQNSIHILSGGNQPKCVEATCNFSCDTSYRSSHDTQVQRAKPSSSNCTAIDLISNSPHSVPIAWSSSSRRSTATFCQRHSRCKLRQ